MSRGVNPAQYFLFTFYMDIALNSNIQHDFSEILALVDS